MHLRRLVVLHVAARSSGEEETTLRGLFADTPIMDKEGQICQGQRYDY